ncbi:MAG: CHAT domain-containing protein [Chloroflexi bacterium CFX4]|nr:CHAT domain-containing protein [Chloroflexi bacterium CFX4]MDL1921813.1 CHAT domain-containing protein [Chloroflexi bacterium CFX3]
MPCEPLQEALCDETLDFSAKLACIRQQAASLTEDEICGVAKALKTHSDGQRNNLALEAAFQNGVLCFLLGKYAAHGKDIAFGYAHLIHAVIYNHASNYVPAYRHFQRAERYFLRAEDDYGWARVILGKVWAAVWVKQTDSLESDFALAAQVFRNHADNNNLAILYGNTLAAYGQLGEAYITKRRTLLPEYTALGDLLEPAERGRLYDNVGYWHTQQGDERQAAHYHRMACELLENIAGYTSVYLNALLNLAESTRRLGRIQEALRYIQRARDRLPPDLSPGLRRILAQIVHNEAACLRALNQHDKALQDLEGALGNYTFEALECVHLYRELGITYAELEDYPRALWAFDQALNALPDDEKINRNRLRLMRLGVQTRQLNQDSTLNGARADLQNHALQLVSEFSDDSLYRAEAHLLAAQTFMPKENGTALHHAQAAAEIAENLGVLPLQHDVNIMLGRLHESSNATQQASRCYAAAMTCIEEMQRSLAIPFRSRFLSSKGEALQRLTALHIRQGNYAEAFNAVERSKASTFLSLIIGDDVLNLPQDQHSRSLLEEIEKLRAQLYAVQVENRPKPADFEQQRARLSELNNQYFNLMEITHGRDPRAVLDWQAIQRHLPPKGLLCAFYDDGEHLNLFWFGSHSSAPHYAKLAQNLEELDGLLNSIRFGIDAALTIMRGFPPFETAEAAIRAAALDKSLAPQRQRFARHMEDLFRLLLAPLMAQLPAYEQLFIVPYGDLHNVPLHLLRAPTTNLYEAHYLIERHTISVLPTASLIAPSSAKRSQGALVVWDDQLLSAQRQFRHSRQTAELICRALPNSRSVHVEAITPEAVLAQAQGTVMHLIAHAEYDPEYPSQSRIWLGKQRLTMLDILQQRLDCPLVFLNSCRIGQLHVEKTQGKRAAGDDLIGLGRAFLYAGVGALITSLWDIFDGFTIPLIEPFYTALQNGASSAAALRTAQLAFRQQYQSADSDLHPILWGAFQNIGR